MTPKNSTHHSLSRRVFATVFAVAMLVVVVFSLAGTASVQGRLVTLAHEELDNQSGVVAAALNSTLSESEQQRIKRLCSMGKIKLLYISPERIKAEADWFLPSLDISLIAIDEAH